MARGTFYPPIWLVVETKTIAPVIPEVFQCVDRLLSGLLKHSAKSKPMAARDGDFCPAWYFFFPGRLAFGKSTHACERWRSQFRPELRFGWGFAGRRPSFRANPSIQVAITSPLPGPTLLLQALLVRPPPLVWAHQIWLPRHWPCRPRPAQSPALRNRRRFAHPWHPCL